MTGRQRRRIDTERCFSCGFALPVLASIEEAEVVERILAYLDRDEATVGPAHPRRAPPPGRLPA